MLLWDEEKRMSSNKLAVTFPGIGYHNDKPLLYYSKKLLKQMGFDVIEITYTFPLKAKEIKGDKDKMEDAFTIAVRQAKEQLSSVEFDKYERVLFIGKSIGTTVAAYCDKEYEVCAKHIVLTPVPQTFEFLKPGCGIVFNGNEDPWCETSLVTEKCKELGVDAYIVDHANHSLETNSALVDVENLKDVLSKIESYVKTL
jgi:phosphoglycolate phosphatase